MVHAHAHKQNGRETGKKNSAAHDLLVAVEALQGWLGGVAVDERVKKEGGRGYEICVQRAHARNARERSVPHKG